MSQYIKLLQHNGGFISVLADDNGVIQYTTNDADYADITAGGSTVSVDATLDGDGSIGDPLTVLSAPTATTATTAAGPANAATFTAALNQSTTALKGLQGIIGKGLEEKAGANLTDADQTITPGSSKCSVYRMPAGTITQNRTITLGTAGASTGDIVILLWQDLGNFTVDIHAGGGGGIATIVGATNGQAKKYQFYFTAGDWIFNAAEWVNT